MPADGDRKYDGEALAIQQSLPKALNCSQVQVQVEKLLPKALKYTQKPISRFQDAAQFGCSKMAQHCLQRLDCIGWFSTCKYDMVLYDMVTVFSGMVCNGMAKYDMVGNMQWATV